MCVRVRTLSYKYTVVHARPLRLSARSSTGAGGIATAIKDNNNSVLYMYIGGGAVDHEQSYLLGGVVVSYKNWRWAALVYAATRMAGLASNNSLGPLNSALMIPMDGEDGELTTVPVGSKLEAIGFKYQQAIGFKYQ